MKKTCFLFVLFFLLTPVLLTSLAQDKTPQPQKARVIVEKARIYLESNPYSFVIDTVGRGTVVTLFQTGKKDKKWLYISYYSNKRMAQVTGFIDVNLVEIIAEEPKNPEPNEEIEEKSVTKRQDRPALQSETESAVEEKEEAQEKKVQAEMEKEESTEAEKGQTDIHIERTDQRNEPKRLDKESAKEQEERSKIKSEGVVDTKKESEQKLEAEKELVEGKKKIEEPAEPETAEEMEVKTEKKKDAAKEIRAEEKGAEVRKESEKQDVKIKTQMGEEEKDQAAESYEEPKKQPSEENVEEVLTKITIKVRKANIRLMPSLKSAIIHQLPSGAELKPLGRSGDWHRVNLPPDEDGFILSGYIHDSIVNKTFEKRVIVPPEPEEPPEEELEISEEKPAPEPSPEIHPIEPTKSTLPCFWIGGGAGYALPSESDFEKGMNFGATLGFGITKYLAVELRVPYYQSDVTGSIEGLSAGRFRAISFTLSVQARYPIRNSIIPYLVGGGDYHLNKFTLDGEVVSSWNAMGFDIEETVGHTFGFHFGGGLDLFVLRNLALNLDVRYYTASLKGDWRLADSLSQIETTGPIDNIKFNSIRAGISLKLFFNR